MCTAEHIPWKYVLETLLLVVWVYVSSVWGQRILRGNVGDRDRRAAGLFVVKLPSVGCWAVCREVTVCWLLGCLSWSYRLLAAWLFVVKLPSVDWSTVCVHFEQKRVQCSAEAVCITTSDSVYIYHAQTHHDSDQTSCRICRHCNAVIAVFPRFCR
jgi:hypothetical protein